MIGALLLQLAVKPLLEQSIARRDVDALMDFWAEDAALELGGTAGGATLLGRPRIHAWLQRWLDAVADVEVTVDRVAVTRPWAIGVSNTLMLELHVEQAFRDGTSAQGDVLAVVEVRATKAVRARLYLLGPTPGRPLCRPDGATGLDVLIPPQPAPIAGRREQRGRRPR